MRVLVTGASGFVGSLLIGRLLESGHSVLAVGRSPERIRAALEGAEGRAARDSHRAEESSGSLELARVDVLTGAGLSQALEGAHVAYYLVHSMERTDSAGTFVERERRAAHNFAAAATGELERLVYLGGLLGHASAGPSAAGPQPSTSPHLASREEVERILLAAVPGSLALRASIVIGARSRSFRLLVRLVERMPVLALPAWQRFLTQPVDERDVIAMLLAAADPAAAQGTLDVGGPDVLSYGEMISRIAELMLVGRPALRLGVGMRGLSSRVAAAIAGEQPELVGPLMEGLRGDLLPSGPDAAKLLGVKLHSFDSAVEHALAEWELREPLAAR